MINAPETCKIMNPSDDDTKFTLYHRLWELKLCFSFVGILLRFLRGRKYVYPKTFFTFISLFYYFLFLSVIHQNTGKPTNMKKADKAYINKIIYKFLFQIYIRIIPLIVFSSMFMHLLRKSDFKKSFGILRTSEYSATSINCSSVT